MIPDGYSLLSPTTDTGLSRATVYYKLLITTGSTFIVILEEDKNTPKSMAQDIGAVIGDLMNAGVDNPSDAIIVFKNGSLSYDGISIDEFGRVDFYRIGGTNEKEVIQNVRSMFAS